MRNPGPALECGGEPVECADAVADGGGKVGPERAELFHLTVSIWCSVVTAFTGGMSMTCRRSTAVTGAFFRDFPQQPHFAGRCRTFLSG